jgi:hypothetical protein
MRYDAIHRAWEPLFRQKLALLLVAALAPPRLVFGAAAAGLIVIEVAVEYWGLGLEHSPWLWPGEPLRTFLYGAFAFAILYRRARDLQLERELIRREQEALVVERLARVALAVHDMTNSPLQTLVASAAIIETDPSQASSVAGGMVRAVAKLEALNDALSAYQKRIVWRIGDESFDPRAVIASAGQGDSSKLDRGRQRKSVRDRCGVKVPASGAWGGKTLRRASIVGRHRCASPTVALAANVPASAASNPAQIDAASPRGHAIPRRDPAHDGGGP